MKILSNLFLFVMLITFSLILVSSVASVCSEPGFTFCWEGSNNFGTASSYAKVFFSLDDDGDFARPAQFAVKRLFAKVGATGDEVDFFTNVLKIEDFDCSIFNKNAVGIACLPNSGIGPGGVLSGSPDYNPITKELTLANVGEKYTSCLSFVAWDCDGDCDNAGSGSEGYWSQTQVMAGYLGSGNCLDIKVVQCYYDQDCSSTQVCDKSSTDWKQWSCISKDSGTSLFYRLENNQCSAVEIDLSSKTANDYNTFDECQSKIIEEEGQLPPSGNGDGDEKEDETTDTGKPVEINFIAVGIAVFFALLIIVFIVFRTMRKKE